MRHLERIIHRGQRRIALLGGVVLLPAFALGLLAFRTFQGERVREEISAGNGSRRTIIDMG